MSASAAFAKLLDATLAVHGSTATLRGDGWRKDNLTVCLRAGWAGAMAGGIGIERIEPTALVRTTDIEDYDFDNGWILEIGDDSYRITSREKDDAGGTTVTLAKL